MIEQNMIRDYITAEIVPEISDQLTRTEVDELKCSLCTEVTMCQLCTGSLLRNDIFKPCLCLGPQAIKISIICCVLTNVYNIYDITYKLNKALMSQF